MSNSKHRGHQVHIMGAAGAGVSSLGIQLSQRLNLEHFETDDFFWKRSTPPYRFKRSERSRLALTERALRSCPTGWILSGALEGWGDKLIELFSAVIFVYTPRDVRLRRLSARETERFGCSMLAVGGLMHDQHQAFLKWASDYDDPFAESRSLRRHKQWLKALPCPVLEVDGQMDLALSVEAACEWLDRNV